MEETLRAQDYRELAKDHMRGADRLLREKKGKRWSAAASPKDKDRWLREQNQKINEMLSYAQINATLAITAKDDEPKQKPEPTLSGLADLVDVDKLIKLVRGEK